MKNCLRLLIPKRAFDTDNPSSHCERDPGVTSGVLFFSIQNFRFSRRHDPEFRPVILIVIAGLKVFLTGADLKTGSVHEKTRHCCRVHCGLVGYYALKIIRNPKTAMIINPNLMQKFSGDDVFQIKPNIVKMMVEIRMKALICSGVIFMVLFFKNDCPTFDDFSRTTSIA